MYISKHNIPNSKVHESHMGPTWGRQDPGGPHVGPMNFAIWDSRGFIWDVITHLDGLVVTPVIEQWSSVFLALTYLNLCCNF